MSNLTKASDCKCCVCGKPAVDFFPVIDPDIPSNPYCDECLDKAILEMAKAVWPDDPGMQVIAKYKVQKRREERARNYNKHPI